MHHDEATAAVTVALALAGGMISQALARHLRIPGIVILLAVGVAMGQDGLHLLDPGSLGHGLHILVGFAVAVILFEGGMNLNVNRLRHEAGVIQRLLTVGAVVTLVGATLATRWIMGWDWPLAVAFGSLVVVTGPTVITPLLRRIKVKHSVATVLEAEGVLIDAVGAILAVVVLEVIIGATIGEGLIGILSRLGLGLVLGVVGGVILAALLRVPHIVPEGLENVFALSLVLALFQISNAILAESGIMSVTAAGMIVGNAGIHVHEDLLEFKEQLTVMLIGMLFILLAANVRIAEVIQLGWPAVATVAALMLIVRPVNIAVCTAGSKLGWRERAFLSWLAPRGVVAAAVASLFAQSFESAGISGGTALQGLVFLVIAATVVIQGLSGGLVAQLLGLRRPAHEGYTILGANELGHTLGRLLRMVGEEVAFVDNNPGDCKVVQEDGFKVIYGNILNEHTMARARLDERAACIAATSNEEINLLFARTAIEGKVPRVVIALRRDQSVITTAVVAKEGASVLFGVPRDLDVWSVRLRRKMARLEGWRLTRKPEGDLAKNYPAQFPPLLLLPLVLERGEDAYPVHDRREFRKDDVVYFALFAEKQEEAQAWLTERGWEFVRSVEEGELARKAEPLAAAG